jgi:hypothetical protein
LTAGLQRAADESPALPAPAQRALTRLLRFSHSQHELRYCLVCCAAVLLCVLLGRPFADCSFNDDWAYSHVALKLAETGRLHYSGWGSPMILFQSFWGAAWIRAFGFSFDILRIATLPFSIGFVLLVYALGRRAGLPHNLACFGALTVGTSPLFVPLASSFMTEPYACFFGTLCIYAAISSAEASSSARATRWLWILAGSGILGGSDRQTVWTAPLALIPYVFWVRRLDRRFSIQAASAYVICIGSLAFLLHRFAQPYGPTDLSRRQLFELVLKNSDLALVCVASSLLSCLLVSWPAFLCATRIWKQLGKLRIIGLVAVCAGITFFFLLMSIFGFELGLVPFMGNILTPFGILKPGQDALGPKPVIIPMTVRIVLTFLLTLSVAIFGHHVRAARGNMPRVPLTAFAIVACAYIPLLFPGGLMGLTYDRYLLPLFPLVVISVLLSFRCHVGRVPFSAWACLSLFAVYSIVTTHDYYSALRARILAARSAETGGIPAARLSVGFERDGWTQLELAGSIRTFHYGDTVRRNSTDLFWFWNYTTALQPDYYEATYSRAADAPRDALLNIHFATWLPPFQRLVVVLRRADRVK